MGILDSIKSGIKGHFDKRQEEREMMEKLQFEADLQRRQTFEEEFRKNALEVAKAKAKQDAARLSGIQKLRAENRLRRLTQIDANKPMGFFEKMRTYTQKNMARREANLKRTAEMRETARKMREERKNTAPKRRPFSPSNI
jgi:hypothetical protein